MTAFIRWRLCARVFQALGLSAALAATAQPAPPDSDASDPAALRTRATAALENGDVTKAVALATEAIAADPANPDGYDLRGSIYEKTGQHAKAIADIDEAIKRRPDSARFFQRRGVEHFRVGQFRQAVADFDRAIALRPEFEPHHWQRGIACYYAGQFEKGRRQFELHQTVNRHDVENAAWHFLCVARLSGPVQARASLIPIAGDSRVPMAEIHQLYAGKLDPEGVVAAARAGSPPAEKLRHQLFYAHLYLGLYFEVLGEADKAREHIAKAAGDFRSSDYMGDVARVHLELLEKSAK